MQLKAHAGCLYFDRDELEIIIAALKSEAEKTGMDVLDCLDRISSVEVIEEHEPRGLRAIVVFKKGPGSLEPIVSRLFLRWDFVSTSSRWVVCEYRKVVLS